MKTKNFLISGIAGGITDFLLGWLIYGMIFKDSFEQPEEGTTPLLLIFLGCLTFGLFIAFIFTKWAQISTVATGAKAGAIIGLFVALFNVFFGLAMDKYAEEPVLLGLAISVVMSAIVGAVVGAVNGKLG